MRPTFTIPGKLPNLNDYITANRRHNKVGAKLKHDTDEAIQWQIKRQCRNVRFTQPVHMLIRWAEPDKRRDPDNVAAAKKFILDAMVKAGMLAGDGWAQVSGFTDEFVVDRKEPRAEIYVTEVKNEANRKSISPPDERNAR